MDNIWGIDVADFYYVLLAFIVNMRRVIPLKDKKDTTVNTAFQKVLNGSNQKLNKI